MNVNTMMNYANIISSSIKTPMLLPEYYDKCVDRMEDYLNGIDDDLCHPIRDGPFCANTVEDVGTATHDDIFIVTRLKKEVNDKRCIRELRGDLPLGFYNYICGCKSPRVIWNTLNETFQGNERT
ncbi:unnamed protein product [Lactuca saligna]|uniref:Uncharacterized protein n=1 Tax=Lactuca saligna TaxID=75948 RepID=A0AA35YAA6_LACSI|nr:unnamed protein product [Lactuca saligna]